LVAPVGDGLRSCSLGVPLGVRSSVGTHSSGARSACKSPAFRDSVTPLYRILGRTPAQALEHANLQVFQACDGLEPSTPLLATRSDRQRVATSGNGLGLIWPFSGARAFATACHWLRPLGSINVLWLRLESLMRRGIPPTFGPPFRALSSSWRAGRINPAAVIMAVASHEDSVMPAPWSEPGGGLLQLVAGRLPVKRFVRRRAVLRQRGSSTARC